MRSSINTRTNVVLGNRHGQVVVAGSDRSQALADAHRLVTGRLADFTAAFPGESATAKSAAPMAKPTAAMRRTAGPAGTCYARGRHAGIPARQCWHRSHRLPQAVVSRG